VDPAEDALRVAAEIARLKGGAAAQPQAAVGGVLVVAPYCDESSRRSSSP
jgi:hypothetical protein